MFGIGGTEIILILLVALLVFGPENLPQMARKIASVVREVRRAGEEVRMHVDPDGEIYRATHFPPIPTLPSSYYDHDDEDDREDKNGGETGKTAGSSPETGADTNTSGETAKSIPPGTSDDYDETPSPDSRGDKEN